MSSMTPTPTRQLSSPVIHTHTLSPSTNPLSPPQPEYAEILTPLKLRKRRPHRTIPSNAPSLAGPSSVPLAPGPSTEGYYTQHGDLFRNTTSDPTILPIQVDEDAITISGNSTSSSSSGSSWGSGNLERGRRATLAVFGRVGEALGVRRGSDSSSNSSASEDGEGRSRRLRLFPALTRTTTMGTADGEKPKRQHLPRKRQFTLLLPPPDVVGSGTGTPRDSISIDSGEGAGVYPPDRVINTPNLGIVIEKIRGLRALSGYTPESTTPLDIPVRRGGSAPGHSRTRAGVQRPHLTRHGHTSFANPPVPQRLQVLREVKEPVRPKSVSDLMGMREELKGKGGSTASLSALKGGSEVGVRDVKGKGKEGCWWLDVSCPTWEDLRDLGELLSLHPLTLEDVLQQDPREKLDHFDRLGYYFLVVRALDEGYFKYTPGSSTSLVGSGIAKAPQGMSPEIKPSSKEGSRRGWGMGRATGKHASKDGEKVEIVEDNPGKEGLEGVGVGALNVYLVVFADGIVSFHFDDINKHTKRVLDRLLALPGSHSADWIAHGLLDSIVDAFFPLIRYVDGEVDDIDSLTIDPTTDPKRHTLSSPSPDSAEGSPSSSLTAIDEKAASKMEQFQLDEKLGVKSTWRTPKPKSSRPRRRRYTPWIWFIHLRRSRNPKTSNPIGISAKRILPLPRPFTYLRLFFLPTTSAVPQNYEAQEEQVFDRSTMLKRITDMRRLVTGLTRLLGGKHQVIGRLRKRAKEEGGSVEAYIGDVEDHILLLQTSLYHYEYILAHCQPAYLSHLSVSFSFARGGTDRAVLALSTVAIGVLPMQVIIGLFSMNVHIPNNGQEANPHKEADGSMSPFNYFAGVVVGIFLVACGVLGLIRYWRWVARQKWAAIRGQDVPDWWDGYWGWR